MPTKLRKLKISRVAVCRQGANFDEATGEGAHILLFKSNGDSGAGAAATTTAPCSEQDHTLDPLTSPYGNATPKKKRRRSRVQHAATSTASQNDLPDGSFAYVEPGQKDSSGRTTPRSKRHLPYKTASGAIDKPHLRNALARLSQTDISDEAKASARRKLVAAAHRAGIEVSEEMKKYDSPMGMHPEPDGDEEAPLDYTTRGEQYDLWEELWGDWQCFCETFYDIVGDSDEDNIEHLPILVDSIDQFLDAVEGLCDKLALTQKMAPVLHDMTALCKVGAPMAQHRKQRLEEALKLIQDILDECSPLEPPFMEIDRAGVSAAEVAHIPLIAKETAMAVAKNAESDKEHCDNCDDSSCDNPAHDRMKKQAEDARAQMRLADTLTKTEAELATVKALLAKAQESLAVFEEDARIAKMTPEEQRQALLDSMPALVRKDYLEKEARYALIEKTNQELRDEKDRLTYIAKTAELVHAGFVPDDDWEIMKAIDLGIPLTTEQGEKLFTKFRALNEQLRTSDLWSARGTPGTPMTNGVSSSSQASTQIMGMAEQLRKEQNLPMDKAIEHVAKEHPELWDRHIRELRSTNRVQSGSR